VIGGTFGRTLHENSKARSARYLDALPTHGSADGNAFRDLEMEQEILAMTQSLGVGAQFGGKYFCHDVRVIRLPRTAPRCRIGLGVSCAADRQVLGKITKDGVYLEELEHNPAQYLPAVEQALGGEVVKIDLNRPMKEILATLSKHPIKTRLSLTGTMIVARDSAHTKLRERLEKGEPLPIISKIIGLLCRSRQDAGRLCLRRVRSHDRRADGLVRRPVPGGGRIDGDGGQGQPRGRGARGLQEHGGFYLGSTSGALRQTSPSTASRRSRWWNIPNLAWEAILAHRGRGFPGLHHHR